MFELEDLDEHFGQTMQIDGSTYTLEKHEDPSGKCAVWKNDSYLIYATPAFEGIAVPVQVMDSDNNEVGIDGYHPEINTYERYCKIVKTLAEKILRQARM
jgi:hypothetical protein